MAVGSCLEVLQQILNELTIGGKVALGLA